MKKYIGIALAVLMVLSFTGMAAATTTDTLELTIKIKVLPWVMARPCLSGRNTLWLSPMPQGIGVLPAETFGPIEDFYANLPVTVTISGDNPADDGFPQFAREELNTDGTGKERFDRLSTHIVITTHVNAFQPDPNYDSFVTEFHAPNIRPSGKKTWTDNVFTLPTPHDGEVWEEFSIYADRNGPKWEIDNDYARSADAGVYELTLTKTLVANEGTLQTRDL